jgi:hypothetical protein
MNSISDSNSHFSTLTKEAAGNSRTVVPNYHTIRRHIPEDWNLEFLWYIISIVTTCVIDLSPQTSAANPANCFILHHSTTHQLQHQRTKKPNSSTTNRKSKTAHEATLRLQLGWEIHSDNCVKEDSQYCTLVTMWNNLSVVTKSKAIAVTGRRGLQGLLDFKDPTLSRQLAHS